MLREIFGEEELSATSDRFRFDPAICGGRPHIRGTRVRAHDILRLMAHGVASSEILADYSYLTIADLRAALAFGADASAHRIMQVARSVCFLIDAQLQSDLARASLPWVFPPSM